mgnify:CR=1 FL=1
MNVNDCVCGIIIGEADSEKEAEKLAEAMRNCPHLLFSGTSMNRVYSVYVVPASKKWWLKIPGTDPNEAGFKRASVHIIDSLTYPAVVNLRLPDKMSDVAPCGADCSSCPLRSRYACDGCPATIHFKRRT